MKSEERAVGSKLEEIIERALFASRWILAPIFLGLSLALLALGVKFFQEAWHVFQHLLTMEESDLVLIVLSMIDIALVGSLIVMVMFSGYENFVSSIDTKGSDTLGFGKLDAGTLKLKVAASIVAISSIHLLRIFMQAENTDNEKIMWYIILHMTFVVSAVLLGVLDKMSFAKHRDHSPTA
ncbi:MAG: TIGR00645 family protein [Pseudomonadota bacterium]